VPAQPIAIKRPIKRPTNTIKRPTNTDKFTWCLVPAQPIAATHRMLAEHVRMNKLQERVTKSSI
jgi:hypothetical protein